MHLVTESSASAMPTALRGQTGAAFNASAFLGIALTIAFVVAFGFGQTFKSAVVHPRFPLPAILYFHIGLFSAWIVLFVAQAAFIRFNRRKWHRQLGFVGIALGASMPFVGVDTAILMANFHVATGHPHAVSSLAVPFSDMVAFGIAFWLAIHPVFCFGLPSLVGIHATAMWLFIAAPPGWVAIANAMLRLQS